MTTPVALAVLRFGADGWQMMFTSAPRTRPTVASSAALDSGAAAAVELAAIGVETAGAEVAIEVDAEVDAVCATVAVCELAAGRTPSDGNPFADRSGGRSAGWAKIDTNATRRTAAATASQSMSGMPQRYTKTAQMPCGELAAMVYSR